MTDETSGGRVMLVTGAGGALRRRAHVERSTHVPGAALMLTVDLVRTGVPRRGPRRALREPLRADHDRGER